MMSASGLLSFILYHLGALALLARGHDDDLHDTGRCGCARRRGHNSYTSRAMDRISTVRPIHFPGCISLAVEAEARTSINPNGGPLGYSTLQRVSYRPSNHVLVFSGCAIGSPRCTQRLPKDVAAEDETISSVAHPFMVVA